MGVAVAVAVAVAVGVGVEPMTVTDSRASPQAVAPVFVITNPHYLSAMKR